MDQGFLQPSDEKFSHVSTNVYNHFMRTAKLCENTPLYQYFQALPEKCRENSAVQSALLNVMDSIVASYIGTPSDQGIVVIKSLSDAEKAYHNLLIKNGASEKIAHLVVEETTKQLHEAVVTLYPQYGHKFDSIDAVLKEPIYDDSLGYDEFQASARVDFIHRWNADAKIKSYFKKAGNEAVISRPENKVARSKAEEAILLAMMHKAIMRVIEDDATKAGKDVPEMITELQEMLPPTVSLQKAQEDYRALLQSQTIGAQASKLIVVQTTKIAEAATHDAFLDPDDDINTGYER